MRQGLKQTSSLIALFLLIALGLAACGGSSDERKASLGSSAQTAKKKKKPACKKKAKKKKGKKGKKGCAAGAAGEGQAGKKDKDKSNIPGGLTLSGCPSGVVKGNLPVTLTGTAAPVDGTPVHIEFLQFNGDFNPVEADVPPDASGAWTFTFTPNTAAGAPPNWDESLGVDYEGGDETADDQECAWKVG
jgi:hypothetical protein